MVRRGSWQEFPQQLSGMGVGDGVFYRRRTAARRASRSELQRRGPLLALALSSRAEAIFCARFVGRRRSATTSVCGCIALFFQGPAGAAEHERSGGPDGGVRAHGAPLHRHRPARLKAAARWALSHRPGGDRGVLAFARAAASRAGAGADGWPRAADGGGGAQHAGPAGAAPVGGHRPGVRSLRRASCALAGQARLGVALRIGGVL